MRPNRVLSCILKDGFTECFSVIHTLISIVQVFTRCSLVLLNCITTTCVIGEMDHLTICCGTISLGFSFLANTFELSGLSNASGFFDLCLSLNLIIFSHSFSYCCFKCILLLGCFFGL